MRNLCEIDQCSKPLSVCRITPKDFDLLKCGVPQVPQNARFVDLYKVYTYSAVLGADGSSTAILLDEKKTVDAVTDFYLHKISFIGSAPPAQASGYYVRFQWPGGRYSSQQLQDVETYNGVIWTLDSKARPVGLRIPAANTIGIGLKNTANAAVNVTILFEGVSRYYLREAA